MNFLMNRYGKSTMSQKGMVWVKFVNIGMILHRRFIANILDNGFSSQKPCIFTNGTDLDAMPAMQHAKKWRNSMQCLLLD